MFYNPSTACQRAKRLLWYINRCTERGLVERKSHLAFTALLFTKLNRTVPPFTGDVRDARQFSLRLLIFHVMELLQNKDAQTDEDDDEYEECAISDYWHFEQNGRRWSRLDSKSTSSRGVPSITSPTNLSFVGEAKEVGACSLEIYTSEAGSRFRLRNTYRTIYNHLWQQMQNPQLLHNLLLSCRRKKISNDISFILIYYHLAAGLYFFMESNWSRWAASDAVTCVLLNSIGRAAAHW